VVTSVGGSKATQQGGWGLLGDGDS